MNPENKTPVEQAVAPVENFTSTKEPTYAKHGLTSSVLFNRTERDILEIVLEDGKTYTVDQAKAEINKFKEGM